MWFPQVRCIAKDKTARPAHLGKAALPGTRERMALTPALAVKEDGVQPLGIKGEPAERADLGSRTEPMVPQVALSWKVAVRKDMVAAAEMVTARKVSQVAKDPPALRAITGRTARLSAPWMRTVTWSQTVVTEITGDPATVAVVVAAAVATTTRSLWMSEVVAVVAAAAAVMVVTAVAVARVVALRSASC
jgi:hypothetical protein